MDYLIDTHILIWHTEKDEKLSKKLIEIIENPLNKVFVSKISLFEIVIKQSIKKLNTTKTPNEFFQILIENNFSLLKIDIAHLSSYSTLPFFHRDPFDRLIIAQALAEDLTIITYDKNFKQYPVKISE